MIQHDHRSDDSWAAAKERCERLRSWPTEVKRLWLLAYSGCWHPGHDTPVALRYEKAAWKTLSALSEGRDLGEGDDVSGDLTHWGHMAVNATAQLQKHVNTLRDIRDLLIRMSSPSVHVEEDGLSGWPTRQRCPYCREVWDYLDAEGNDRYPDMDSMEWHADDCDIRTIRKWACTITAYLREGTNDVEPPKRCVECYYAYLDPVMSPTADDEMPADCILAKRRVDDAYAPRPEWCPLLEANDD